ncbi:MAG: glycosyltransferase [Prosthecobacter sp.]|nr:glycosyltransferase [Prosthecobacter sp.]
MDDKPDDLASRLQEKSMWYEESQGLLRGWRVFPLIAWRTWKVCRQVKPKLLICWPSGLSVWICLGAWLAGVSKLIVHSGNPPNRGTKGDWLTRYVMWPLWIYGARVVCCSDYVRNEFLKIPFLPRVKMYAIHNCVRAASIKRRSDVARKTRMNRSNLTAIMVATLELHKDHETLLRALPNILVSHAGFRLRLVGDGSLRDQLKLRVHQLGLEDHVEFLGSRQDVPELLGGADLFIFSTTPQEGFGSVLLEALAAGLPIVASDVPACREILDEGKWGLLVKARDPEALAEAIARTCDALSTESEMQRIARSDHSLLLSPESMLNQYINLFS